MKKRIYLFLAISAVIVIIGILKSNLIKKDQFIDQEAAKTIFLRDILKTEVMEADAVAFMHPNLLTEEDKISPYLPHPLLDGISQAPYLGEDAFFKITTPIWFFWIDNHAFAKFAHSTQFVYVDAKTGSFEITEEMWWPLLNGKIIWDDNAYWSGKDWVYNKLKSGRQKMSSNFDLGKIASNLQTIIPVNSAMANDPIQNDEKSCILTVNGWRQGQTGEKDFAVDQEKMGKVFKGRAYKKVELGPADEIKSTLMVEIEKLADECDDVIIYITSHGAKYEDGTDALVLGGFILKDTFLSLYLQSLALDYPKVTFKIVIDACYSGSFIDQLKKAKNVALVITASDSNEYSYQDVEESFLVGNWKPDPNSEDEGCEFSSGLIEDIQQILADKKKTEELKLRAEKNSTSFDVELLKEAFKSAVAKDFCVANGLTHPQIYEKSKTKEDVTPKEETTSGQEPEKKTESSAKEESVPKTAITPNQKPVITAINITQLHKNYEDIPHKYQLSVVAYDSDNNLPLSYSWSIDCGFIFNSKTLNPVEWHYNIPGECINAKATVTIIDSLGAINSLTKPLFP